VSEILNCTSAQLYSAIHIGSRWKIAYTGQKTHEKTDNTETKRNREKQTTQNTAKQNYINLVAFYDNQPTRKRGGLPCPRV